MFNKKPAEKKLKILNEKEIQERLYGSFHRSEMVGEPKPKVEGAAPTSKAPAAPVSAIFTPKAASLEVAEDDRDFVDEEGAGGDLFGAAVPQAEKPALPKVKAPKPQAAAFRKDSPTSAQKSASSADAWQKIEDLINQSVAAVKKIHPAYLGGAVLAILLICGLVFAIQLISSALKEQSQKSTASAVIETTPSKPAVKVKPEAGQSTLKLTKKDAVLTPSVPEEIKATGGYSIQLCLSDNFEASKKVMASLKAKGYEGYIRKVQGSAASQLYQIFVGRFPTAQEAGEVLKTLRSDEEFAKYSDSFVRTAR